MAHMTQVRRQLPAAPPLPPRCSRDLQPAHGTVPGSAHTLAAKAKGLRTAPRKVPTASGMPLPLPSVHAAAPFPRIFVHTCMHGPAPLTKLVLGPVPGASPKTLSRLRRGFLASPSVGQSCWPPTSASGGATGSGAGCGRQGVKQAAGQALGEASKWYAGSTMDVCSHTELTPAGRGQYIHAAQLHHQPFARAKLACVLPTFLQAGFADFCGASCSHNQIDRVVHSAPACAACGAGG